MIIYLTLFSDQQIHRESDFFSFYTISIQYLNLFNSKIKEEDNNQKLV